MLPKIDLLGGRPLDGDAATGARRAFDFLWATGSGIDALDLALRPRPESNGHASTFEPSVFAADLFATELARRCLPVVAEGRARAIDAGRLEGILVAPPRSPDVVVRRRAVLRALAADDEMRRAAEAFYARARELRDMLESRGASRDRAAEQLRRIEVLHALRKTIEALAAVGESESESERGGGRGRTAEGKQGSALEELAAWARGVRESEAFGRLRDLLAWESGASTVELSMRIGADGHVRGVTMLARRDLPSPAGDGPLSRFLRRLWRVLRGERWDEREILARLVDDVMDGLTDAALVVLRASLDLEPHLASLGLRDRARAAGLDACLPSFTTGDDPGGLRFDDLYNPFLLADAVAKDAAPPVPCDLDLEGATPIAVVTGPNSGGKTRLLQSIGVAVLLGRGGFFVPARRATLAWTPALFASLAQPATHDAPEGRLGTELLRVRDVFERARPGCLVLLDELCSGTNPSEAEELVRFVLAELAAARASAIVTTHLLDVAHRLESDPPAPHLSFRCVELDADERPTYRFVNGVATSSLARRTAERLGVTHEALARLVRERRALGDATPTTLPDDLVRSE